MALHLPEAIVPDRAEGPAKRPHEHEDAVVVNLFTDAQPEAAGAGAAAAAAEQAGRERQAAGAAAPGLWPAGLSIQQLGTVLRFRAEIGSGVQRL